MAAPKRGTGGRRSKGERRALITRVSPGLHEEIQNRADAVGLSITDYLAQVLAEHVREPAPSGAQQRLFVDDEELAMTG